MLAQTHHIPAQHSHPPPTKASLKAWWNHFAFVQRTKKDVELHHHYNPVDTTDHPVFGRPLKESLRYASVQISTANSTGELYVWGYIPVVVAKCGLYLKENATEVPGTFRVSGSNKRMRELQAQFETPPRYGKSLDWRKETYTTHDVASVFRRYLTQMPEPVIPYDMYHNFRNALLNNPTQETLISTYKELIRQMPRANQYLLLYVLDLLSVFARKSDKNLMTAANLAVIFRPGLISHPQHEMLPHEHPLSQRVLEFLIAQQDWFMLDIPKPQPPTPPIPAWNFKNTPSGDARGREVRQNTEQGRVHIQDSGRERGMAGNERGNARPSPRLPNLVPTRAMSDIDEVMLVSPDEQSQLGGDWNMISKEVGMNPVGDNIREREQVERLRMIRRQIKLKHGDKQGLLTEGDMSPPPDSAGPVEKGPDLHAVGVVRRRTLPNSRRRDDSDVAAISPLSAKANPPERERSKVLRKNKRISLAADRGPHSQQSSGNE